MFYLTGAFRKNQIADLVRLGVGVMLQPGNGYTSSVERFPVWAADNGCFAQGESFSVDKWLRWLEKVPRSRLLFCVAPDVVGDAGKTFARSVSILTDLKAMGLPTAFALQNGVTEGIVPWELTDWVFIGGTTDWKLGHDADRIVQISRRYGKSVHMGRVNSERRWKRALMMGCDSCDGTYLAFRNRPGGDGTRGIERWQRQGVMAWPTE